MIIHTVRGQTSCERRGLSQRPPSFVTSVATGTFAKTFAKTTASAGVRQSPLEAAAALRGGPPMRFKLNIEKRNI